MKEKHIPRNNVKEEHKTQQQCKERAQVLLTMQMKSMRFNNNAKKEHGTQQHKWKVQKQQTQKKHSKQQRKSKNPTRKLKKCEAQTSIQTFYSFKPKLESVVLRVTFFFKNSKGLTSIYLISRFE